MKKWLQNGKGHIAAACYLAALLVWLCIGTAHLAGDGIAALRGRMPETMLKASDFTLVDLNPVGDVLSCASADPQMHWTNTQNIRVRGVTLRAVYESSRRRYACTICWRDKPISRANSAFSPRSAPTAAMLLCCRARILPHCGSMFAAPTA